MSTTNKSLKQALQDARLTVKDFANISDTSIKTIYHWVNGESRTPGISLKCLAMHLEIKRLREHIIKYK